MTLKVVGPNKRVVNCWGAARFLGVPQEWVTKNLSPDLRQGPLWYVDHLNQLVRFADSGKVSDLTFVPSWPCEFIHIQWDYDKLLAELREGPYKLAFRTMRLPPSRDSWKLTEAQLETRAFVAQDKHEINPKVWELVDALNAKNIFTQLSGDYFKDDVLYVIFPARYKPFLPQAVLPRGWRFYEGAEEMEAFVNKTEPLPPKPGRFRWLTMAKRGAYVDKEEAVDVARAIDRILPDHIRSLPLPGWILDREPYYLAVNWAEKKQPLAFANKEAWKAWVAINGRCKAIKAAELFRKPYNYSRKSYREMLQPVAWWQEMDILGHPRFWYEGEVPW